MKRIISCFLMAVIVVLLVGCSTEPNYPYKADFTELGIPLKDYYTVGNIQRCVWDIEAYKGGIYVASGDYDKNKGPIKMYRYDIKSAEWSVDGYLPDEQIERFYIFDGRLYAAGCDPRDGWEKGNIYVSDGDGWTTQRVLPGGIHNFDLVKFDGKMFAGMGVNTGQYPIAMTEDGGNWSQVPLFKDGEKFSTASSILIRVYDFFVLEDNLYAYFYYRGDKGLHEIYRYEDGKFVYYSDLINQLQGERQTYAYINQKVQFNKKQFIAKGNLYSTSDMKTAEQIELKQGLEVTDLKVIGDKLYILCNESVKNDDGTEEFRVSVWSSENGDSFEEIFYFNYSVRALSFTYNDAVFYFGMGYGVRAQTDYEQNGMILAVENEI